MADVILGSDRKREIGARYTGVKDDGEVYPDQPFVVIREATVQEWIEDGFRRLGRASNANCDISKAWFYEVSMD